MINPQKGIDLMNNTSIIIRILFAVTIFQHESRLLEISLLDQVVETDSLMGYSLPGPIHSDDDALLICQDDHISCLDTSVWDPGPDDLSRVNAQEDTTTHIGYSAIQM
jgi:hypothetical protein